MSTLLLNALTAILPIFSFQGEPPPEPPRHEANVAIVTLDIADSIVSAVEFTNSRWLPWAGGLVAKNRESEFAAVEPGCAAVIWARGGEVLSVVANVEPYGYLLYTNDCVDASLVGAPANTNATEMETAQGHLSNLDDVGVVILKYGLSPWYEQSLSDAYHAPLGVFTDSLANCGGVVMSPGYALGAHHPTTPPESGGGGGDEGGDPWGGSGNPWGGGGW